MLSNKLQELAVKYSPKLKIFVTFHISEYLKYGANTYLINLYFLCNSVKVMKIPAIFSMMLCLFQA